MPKISDLTTRNVSSSDLLAVVDPTTGVAGKATVLAVTAAGTDFLTQAEADALYEPIGGGSAPVELAGTAGNEFIRVEDETLLSSTTGNARGKGAIDLQIKRTDAANVASGAYSAILAGKDCKASGICAVASGQYSVASGNHSVAMGSSCQASGLYAVALGLQSVSSENSSFAAGRIAVASGYAAVALGFGVTAQGNISMATGERSRAYIRGQVAHAAGRFAADGDAQTSVLVLRNVTTDATQTELFLDGTSEKAVLTDDTTWAFECLIVARRTDADTESAGYLVQGVISRGAGAATTALVGTITKTVLAEDTAGWDVAVDADATNGSLRVRVTGEADKDIRWVARVVLAEVAG